MHGCLSCPTVPSTPHGTTCVGVKLTDWQKGGKGSRWHLKDLAGRSQVSTLPPLAGGSVIVRIRACGHSAWCPFPG